MENLQEKIKLLAEKINAETLQYLNDSGYTHAAKNFNVQVKAGKKYTKIDKGPANNMSGFLMIDESGNIFGIKAYGVIHPGHWYGTLDTTDDFHWGNYSPVRKVIRIQK